MCGTWSQTLDCAGISTQFCMLKVVVMVWMQRKTPLLTGNFKCFKWKWATCNFTTYSNELIIAFTNALANVAYWVLSNELIIAFANALAYVAY